MTLVPIQKMWERVEVARQDSDSSLFMHLLYAGEFVTKLVASGLVSAIADDRDRHRYRQMHRLVRADGLGEWATCIDDVLVGPASQHLVEEAKAEQKELTQKTQLGSWQFEAVSLLDQCLRVIEKNREGLPFALQGRRWFTTFAELRNRTRGHGATGAGTCGLIGPDLERSVRLVTDNFGLFTREWAYLYRNLSGKYRVTKLSAVDQLFGPLKSAKGADKWGSPSDGVYVFLGRPCRVELIFSDPDSTDFFLPNGGFSGKNFELISYLKDSRLHADADPFLKPATDLPPSETEAIGRLEVQGQIFSNLPPVPNGYVSRQGLEQELSLRLADDRHPVITLVGRGGVGKTSLALRTLHQISSSSNRFDAIFWFSSRDIDLLPEGPKLVRPHLLTERDIAQEFVRLMEPEEAATSGFKPVKYFSDALFKSPTAEPLLFVFDNFETARNPNELYAWVDSYIRPPNKVLITTRSRDFKGDYPVEVLGMTEQECDQLIATTADQLGISGLITEDYKREVYKESEGHPYVIKVLLGEVAKAGRLVKIERIVASQDEILEALFERTYANLSPSAKQVFLTLCNWRSTVPQLAVEAVLLRVSAERMDVEQSVEELRRSSFIEVTISAEDDQSFLSVPLVASVFGRRKLSVSPMKAAVEANTELLLYFGAGQKTDIRHGVSPRIHRFFTRIAEKVGSNAEQLGEYGPMLEFVAQKYSAAWLLLSRLYQEAGSLQKAKESLRRYLENCADREKAREAWEQMALLCRWTDDGVGEATALVEMCTLKETPLVTISNAINRWNSLFRYQYIQIGGDERQLLGEKLVDLFDAHSEEATSTDLSRAGWLALALNQEDRARVYVIQGLELDPQNEYCVRLATRLGVVQQNLGLSGA